MIGCASFDDEQPPAHEQMNELSYWVSITELSALLNVSRNTISTAVKRAWANGEPWVKKEKAADGNTRYLIDAKHEMYLSHQQRWKQGKTLRAALSEDTATPWPDALFAHTPVPYTWHGQKRREGVLQRWPRFRHWLYSQGIQIFQNRLSAEGQKASWEWRWGELHGEGCASEEEAIIGALQSRLDAYEAAHEEHMNATLLYMQEQQEQQEPPRKPSLFRRNS